ncbi:26S proteasome regulatory subunit Rpn1p [Diutina catenulata]
MTSKDEAAVASVEKKDKKDPKEPKLPEEELSEEDQQLKDELEQLVEQVTASSAGASEVSAGVAKLKQHIQESTTSMTAVPKPLKFLRPFYQQMVDKYDAVAAAAGADDATARQLADVLSVIATTYSEGRDSLKFRLVSKLDDISEWGHEYMRHLALEIGESYQEQLGDDGYIDKLVQLALEIVPFFLASNADADAVDLLLEIEHIERLPEFVDESTFARVCLYVVSCVPLLAPPEDVAFLTTAYRIYIAHRQLTQALTLAVKLGDDDKIHEVFAATDDELVHRQLGFILAQENIHSFTFSGESAPVQEAISNSRLHEHYRYLVSELNLLDAKVPEDVYKSHLESHKTSASIDSAKQNLAAAFVNMFINLGYGSDKLVQTEDDNKSWIYKTKGQGMVSTTASLGALYQWNIGDGLQVLDKYTYSSETEIKAGALLGTGIVSTNVHDDVDAAYALLQDYVNDPSKTLQASAVNGLGIAFAGSANDDVLALLLPLVSDTEVSLEVSSLAALALGHVFVGTCHGDITSTILQTLLERDFNALANKYIKFMSLGLGLLYMSKTEAVEDVLETIDAIEHPIAKTLKVLVNICAYAGTGNVLQIQSLLQMCTARPKEAAKPVEDDDEPADAKPDPVLGDGDVEMADADASEPTEAKDEKKEEKEEKKDDDDSDDDSEEELYQGIAVLGLALIAMGEDIGQDMSLRHFAHLMHYGNPLIKRAVPLAMGLVSASNPQMKVFDTLSRYSHDPDLEVAQNAIYSMGLVGAGTNNARLAQLLRQLASYYVKSPDSLFMVRIAQGLLHMGKGTLTLNPFNCERSILSKVSLASLLTISVALLDPKSFVLSDAAGETSHEVLYYLCPAIKPRMLITVDEELNPVKVNVRVGQSVDVVGQAGKPKTITGWVTQSTPVLLNYGERAELENDEWLALSHSLEGVVILKKNPEYEEA